MKIFVHQRSMNGILHEIESFDSPMQFAEKYNEYIIKNQFSENEMDQCISWDGMRYRKVAKTEKGKIIQVSQLIGWAHEYINVMRSEYKKMIYNYRQGRKAISFGRFRHPRTMNEMRQYAAANDDEYPVKVRAIRNPNNLPNAWDDYYVHADKNWKRASNRRYQWG
jgi:hypothetical protein